MLQSSGDCISAYHVARDNGMDDVGGLLAVRREVKNDMIDRLPFTSEGLEQTLVPFRWGIRSDFRPSVSSVCSVCAKASEEKRKKKARYALLQTNCDDFFFSFFISLDFDSQFTVTNT